MKNLATSDMLHRAIQQSEQSETKTFELRDRKKSLNRNVKINKEIDSEVHEYLKSEMDKSKKLEHVRNKLRAQVEQGRTDLEQSPMREGGNATEMLSGVEDTQLPTQREV